MDFTGLSGCAAASQILQWNGAGWNCVATPAGGAGGVSSVSVAAPTPITVTGTTAVSLFMAPASASASGYLSEADWGVFNAKAPIASPTFTGTVTAPTFVGGLTGNAATATSAGSATTAGSAGAVSPNVITPSDLNTSTPAGSGQVPMRGPTDTFTWISPLAPPSASCSAEQVLTWNGSVLSCTTPTAAASVPAFASVTPGSGTGAIMSTAASVNFTTATAGRVLILADANFWGQGPACVGIARLVVDSVADDVTTSWVHVPTIASGNNSGVIATSKLVTSLAAGPHTAALEWATTVTGTTLCTIIKNPHLNVIVLN
jgi:hypothetical protein